MSQTDYKSLIIYVSTCPAEHIERQGHQKGKLVCAQVLPEYIFFFEKNEQIQININKLWNIHLIEFAHEKLTDEILISLPWTIIDEQEFDIFLITEK
jgi:hypothetical protein